MKVLVVLILLRAKPRLIFFQVHIKGLDLVWYRFAVRYFPEVDFCRQHIPCNLHLAGPLHPGRTVGHSHISPGRRMLTSAVVLLAEFILKPLGYRGRVGVSSYDTTEHFWNIS